MPHLRRKKIVSALTSLLVVLGGLYLAADADSAWAQSCKDVLVRKPLTADEIFHALPAGWELPAAGSKEYKEFSKTLPPAMERELTADDHWDGSETSLARLPVPVAKLSAEEIDSIRKPRPHQPLPVFAKDGTFTYANHVKLNPSTRPHPSETFHVRMMVIKNKGSMDMILPPQLEYLRPFLAATWKLEMERDPNGFRNRLAYVQVDASWVEAKQNQARPGKTTTQSSDPSRRQGAHVDGFLMKPFWDLKEDITYSITTGFNPADPKAPGDSIPTEYFNVAFPTPPGLTHAQAREEYDRIANAHMDSVVMFPAGMITRMSSRVVHRVGVAREKTYRTFAKVKFSDEIFNQAENSVNLSGQSIYQQWGQWKVPLVDRKTLPTEGSVMPEDKKFFTPAKAYLGAYAPF